MAVLPLFLALGLLLGGVVGVEEGSRNRAAAAHSALKADDACAAEGSASSTCAVSALQQRSHRALADHASTNGDTSSQASSSSLWHRLRSAQYKEFPAELPPDADKDWVWPRDQVYYQLHSSNHVVEKYADAYALLTPWTVGECSRFITYFWPQYSFWMQESLRRIEAVPDDAPPEQTKQLQHFVHQASYLNCVWFADPRKGTEWSEHVTEHMQMVRDRPSTDLEMPDLPEWFSTGIPEFMLYVHDACIFWSSTMTCNLGHIARDVTGNKAGPDVCWDKVQVPTYGYSMFNHSLMPDRLPVEEEPYNHTEYLKCQEKPIDKELLDNFCPFAGHYPDGLLNVSSWGHGPEKGTKRYEDVLKCEAKLDIPNWSTCSNYPIHRANEGNFIDVMKPFKGPLTTYMQLQEHLDNGTVQLAGTLGRALAKQVALHGMHKTEEELTGLEAAGVGALATAAQQAAEYAAKVVISKSSDEMLIMPEK